MLWQYWAEEWALYEKISFNGDQRAIVVHADTVDLDIRVDIWSAWVRWRARGNDHFPEAMRRTGFDLLPGGQRTGDTYFLINGWKLFLELESVKVSGVLFSDDFDTAYYDLSSTNPVYPVKVSSLVNTVVVNEGGGAGGATAAEIWAYSDRSLTDVPAYNGPTVSQIADAVRVELTPELTHVMTLQNGQGLDSTQATMLLEIYRLYGLDPAKPLVVNNAQRRAGSEIVQNITSSPDQTVITRV